MQLDRPPSTPAPAGLGPAARFFSTATGPHDFTGGDATYSVPLRGGGSAWLFGDSFVGGVQPDGSRSNDPATFVRNSIVLQDGAGLRTATGHEDGVPVDAARPPGMAENRNGMLAGQQWYWPGHGTTRGDDLLVFENRFDTPPAVDGAGLGWNWRYGGTDVARFDARTGELRKVTPLLGASDVLWGAAVLERGDHTYVYGAETDPAGETVPRHAHVARVPREQLEDRAAWTFWDGSQWVPDAARSARIGADVSTQFGVVDARDGSTMLLSQQGFDHELRAWTAARPEGPFTGGDVVGEIPPQPGGRHVYNAVPHPQFASPAGDLVVSYNVGGADFMADHTSYRPGFLTIPGDHLPGGGAARAAPPPD
ncbi:MAG: hypothetical protein JWM98_771 [Thermoleophilia bacterium]|nr:hypothetical protein [Thermoleophilia bacterium]